MKKIFGFCIIGAIIFSSIGVIGNENNYILDSDFIRISKPNLLSFDDDYLSVELNEATSYIIKPGEPFLPKITKTFILPFRVKIKDIKVNFLETKKIALSKEIRPCYEPIIDGFDGEIILEKSEEIYKSSELYPKNLYNYKTCTGLLGKEHVVFLSINIFPIRYSPANNILYYNEFIDVNIKYETPSNFVNFPNEYDLAIIAPSIFEEELIPLVDHKNSHDIKTYYVSLEQIYSDFNDGRDDQENIKLYIKNAIEEKGINYVLLVGGLNGQSFEWLLPVRYAQSPNENAYISDLYYSDIYKENGTMFEDWDSNGNNIFAEFERWSTMDKIDGSPDVYLGRLACRSEKEVDIVVNKIIDYENNKADPSWFKRMLLIGGDTYPDTRDGFEAEIYTNLSASYMVDFEAVKLWASLETLTGQEVVEQEINEGAGFIHMAGHANPTILVTHPPHDVNRDIKIIILQMYVIPISEAYWALFFKGAGINAAIEKLFYPRNPRLNNEDKLPIIVIGGCHNSQFNISILNVLKGLAYAYGYGIHGPKCFSWWLTSKEDGGAIATFGNTGLGMGLPDFDYTKGLDGWLFPRFFYNYRQLGKEYIGMAYSSAITDYVNEFDINYGGDDRVRQMIEQWALLGDPTLLPGGYQN